MISYIKYQSILESLFHLPSADTLEYIINIELFQSFHRTYLDLYIPQYDWYKHSLWFHTSSINLYLNLCFTYQVPIHLNISSTLNSFNPFCATRTFLVVSILNSFNILSMYFWHNHISVYWCQIFGFCLSLSSGWNS